ncbi:MAG: class I tRNA ligase family protein, partial [Novosphingobium sp.]|nr:class I tRNA ligase family protein [Novosphingobium sp.]
QAVDDFDFNTYTRALVDFCNEDLSAFYFDIRKDSLYCDAAGDPKRMACRTVLDTLFHALIRYAAPVLVFTSEEVWGTRFPEGGSVHLLEWPQVESEFDGFQLAALWEDVRTLRKGITEAIEPLRRDRQIGSSLEADVTYPTYLGGSHENTLLRMDLAELAIVSKVTLVAAKGSEGTSDRVLVERSRNHKCGRCWRHLPEVTEDGALCSRCDQVVAGMDAAA